MCDYNVLVKNNKGYVVKCEKCGSFCVAFGNIVMQLNDEDFEDIRNLIDRYCERYQNRKNHQCRDIWIHSKMENLRFVFSYKELTEFQNLLHTAQLLLEVERLVDEPDSLDG